LILRSALYILIIIHIFSHLPFLHAPKFVSRVSKIESCVSRLHNFAITTRFAAYWIHFRHARTLLLIFVSRACPSKIDSRVPRLRNFLLTGTLPHTRFTFEVPEHQSYLIIYIKGIYIRPLNIYQSYYYIYIQAHHRAPSPTHANFVSGLSKFDSRVSRLRNFLLTGTFPHTRFTFEVPEHLRFFFLPIFFRN
jgi:hypothetical protein